MRKSFLIVTEAFDIGGLETRIKTEVQGMLGEGHVVHLACGHRFNTALLPHGLSSLTSGLSIGPEATVNDLIFAVEKLRSTIRQHGIDYILAHPFTSLIPCLVAAELEGIPCAVTLHGPLSVGEAYGPLFEFLFFSLILPSAGLIVVVSDEVGDLVSPYISENKTHVHLNTVDFGDYETTSVEEPCGKHWLIVSRLDHQKIIGVADFIRKAVQAGASGIQIAGDGPARESLRSQIETEGLDHLVEFLGFRTDIPDLMRRAAGVAGMGRVVLEGIASQRPVCLVGYDGIKGVIDSGMFRSGVYANFSGRNLPTIGADLLRDQIEKTDTVDVAKLYNDAKRTHSTAIPLEKLLVRLAQISRRQPSTLAASPLADFYKYLQTGLVSEDQAFLYSRRFFDGLGRLVLSEKYRGIDLSSRYINYRKQFEDDRLGEVLDSRLKEESSKLLAAQRELMSCEQTWTGRVAQQEARFAAEREGMHAKLRDMQQGLLDKERKNSEQLHTHLQREREVQADLAALRNELLYSERAWIEKTDQREARYALELEGAWAKLDDLQRSFSNEERKKSELMQAHAERERELRASVAALGDELVSMERTFAERAEQRDACHAAERAALQAQIDNIQQDVSAERDKSSQQLQRHIEQERELQGRLAVLSNELLNSERAWAERENQQEARYTVDREHLQTKLDELHQALLLAEREITLQAKSILERESMALQARDAYDRTLNEQLQSHQIATEKWKCAIAALQSELDLILKSKIWLVTAALRRLARRWTEDWNGFDRKPATSRSSVMTVARISDAVIGSGCAQLTKTPQNEKRITRSMQVVQSEKHDNKSVEDLLELYGELFVREAYLTLLGRHPDAEGLTYYLNRLKRGVNKLEVLAQLKQSKEAKRINAKLPGLGSAILYHKFSRLPLMSWLQPSIERMENKVRAIETRLFEMGNMHSTISQLEAELLEKENYIQDKEIYIAKLLDGSGQGPSRAKAHFNPYEFIELLKPINIIVVDNDYACSGIKQSFSCVCTVKNEANGIFDFLKSISEQKLKPDELIIVDGGSFDDTTVIIESFALVHDLSIKLVKAGSVNIAEGRNIGISKAAHELILLVDAGCELNPGFVENMIGPFSDQPSVDLVSGIYHAVKHTEASSSFISDWSESTDWKNFLPSARAVAIKKSIWQKANGFPEYLTRTGEDTLFDVQYRRHSETWVVNKRASVLWDAPTTREAGDKLSYNYGYGDGESGFGDFRFHADWVRNSHREQLGCLSAQQLGYLDGRRHRPLIEVERRGVKGVILMLSGVPFTDSGGGQRCSQLAMAFASQGYKVVFVNIYPSFEEKNKLFFDIDYSMIEFVSLDDFVIEDLIEAYAQFPRISITALLEFPHPRFIPIAQVLKARLKQRATIVYDYIDNWRSSLGWEWYSEQTEMDVAKVSDHLIASAGTLKTDLEERTNRPVFLIPNAVNDRIFDCSAQYRRPADLPKSDRIVVYTGALWGEWFDWETLDLCINQISDADFVLIGGIDQEKAKTFKSGRPNVHFLGLKPQSELPAYLAYASVCIIPFKVDHITHYVNPLKVYEYLAMQKPVITSAMPELKGLPGVVCASSKKEYARLIELYLSSPSVDNEKIAEFTEANNWHSRVSDLWEAIGVKK